MSAFQARAIANPPPADTLPKNMMKPEELEVPELITNIQTRKTYTRGKFLGRGGFARCYEVRDNQTDEIFACKVVSKNLLVKQHQREKMAQEISVHRDLNHAYIVKFYSFFEDDLNVYVILELCTKKSLMEMQKRRRIVTEPEARYLFRQIMLAISYLHDRKIIHRDLKLGNIFINEDMNLKIGDFGLATTVERYNVKRFTLCGTPNYIAPEVLGKKGHSFEVDIWSAGCILYTLLLGRPPFETNSLKDTYSKIRRGEYVVPNGKITVPVRSLISKMLQVDPALRPNALQVLNSEFIAKGFIPRTLPSSVLTMPPRFDANTKREEPPSTKSKQMPLTEQNQKALSPVGTVPASPRTPTKAGSDIPISVPYKPNTAAHMYKLLKELRSLMATKPLEKNVKFNDETEDPTAAPLLWIAKWVDYSDKYGFGYQLSDDSIGVSFNDTSKMILLPDSSNLQYIDRAGAEFFYLRETAPPELLKKIKLLNYFEQYMSENLLKAGGNSQKPDCSMARLPSVWTWFRTSRAVVMVLTNGTVQINNFRDHTKTILCPLIGAITTLEPQKPMRTYRFAFLEKYGCTLDLAQKMEYAIEKLQVLMNAKAEKEKVKGQGENNNPGVGHNGPVLKMETK